MTNKSSTPKSVGYKCGGKVKHNKGGKVKKKNVSLTKKDKNPKGGLSAKGRAKINKATGSKLKPPVSAKQAKKSKKAATRRKSFCARMSGVKGPLKDSKGRPTRKALALRKWDC
jgi:hypothetical protein